MSVIQTPAFDPQSQTGRKRAKSAKPTSPQGDKSKKVSFYLSDDALKRLGVHATMDGRDRSSLVEQLIQEHLRRYDLPRARRFGPPCDNEEIGQDRATG